MRSGLRGRPLGGRCRFRLAGYPGSGDQPVFFRPLIAGDRLPGRAFAGAAGGVDPAARRPAGGAATFGAPVAAVFLAVELLLGQLRARTLLPVALACVVAAGFRWVAVGAGPLVAVPGIHVLGAGSLPWFVLLGLTAGFLAVG